MQGSWFDHLPSSVQEQVRKRMRSPEAYEALRDKVKGPEDLEREMRRSEGLAELRFAMEMEPELANALKQQVSDDIQKKGIDAVIDSAALSPQSSTALTQGTFTLEIDAHPVTHEDALVIVPEGNVQEKLPVKQVFSDAYVGQFTQTER
jgi:hypothetical protein